MRIAIAADHNGHALKARLTAWLKVRSVHNPDAVAATAQQAARLQHATLPGQEVAAGIVADIATQIFALDDRLKRIVTTPVSELLSIPLTC